MCFSLPFFILLVIWSHRSATNTALTLRDARLLIVLGLLGYYLASLLDFWGLQFISASLERLILFLYPTLVVILSAVFLGQKIGKATACALLLSYAGIFVVFAENLSAPQAQWILGCALVFASILAYAIYIMASGQVIKRMGAARFTGYAMTVSSIAAICHFSAANPVQAIQQPTEVYLLALAMAIIATVIPSLFMAESIRRIGAGHSAMIGSIGPVSTLFLSNLFLGERLSIVQIAGSTLIVAGVIWISVYTHKKPPPEKTG